MQVSIITLQQIAAVLIFTVIVVVAVFKLAGLVKVVLTVLLSILLVTHYLVLFSLLGCLEIRLMPFIVVESNYVASINRFESVFYPDIGQLSALTLIILWRREIVYLIKRGFQRVRRNSGRTG